MFQLVEGVATPATKNIVEVVVEKLRKGTLRSCRMPLAKETVVAPQEFNNLE